MNESAIRLSLGALTIDVDGDDAGALDWLAEFLAPAFSVQTHGSLPADAGAPQHAVRFERAASEHDRLRRNLDGSPEDRWDVFTRDGSFLRYRGWNDPGGRYWIHDKRYDVFYGVESELRSIRIVAPEGAALPRLPLMRVTRELATTALLRSEHLPVHGAAFVHEDTAVLVCGPKRSGKTSLLLHALRWGATFLSNDRLFVNTQGPVVAQAMPTIVSLRDGTLEIFDEVKKALGEAQFDRGRTIAECEEGIELPDSRTRKGARRKGISPAQLCRVVGTSMCHRAPVELLLFPRIDPSADGIVLEPLATGPAREIMGRSLLKPSHPTRSSSFFSPGLAAEEIPAEVEARQCRELVEHVPAYDCRLGPNAFQADLGAVLQRRDG